MNKVIWITWENQIRNKSMASMLGAKLFVFDCSGNLFIRYYKCLLKTFVALIKEKPKVVFAQNPSIILIYFLIFARFIFRYKLVSDAHFAGVIAYNGNIIFQKALDICNYFVDLVIVTNAEHVKYIHIIGGKAAICEDPLPDLTRHYAEDKSGKNVFYICSYDVDEPYEIAFKAAELLAEDGFKFYVSGNYKKAKLNPYDYPSVNFLGYVSEQEYYTYLYQSSVILDLTESDNILLCGAYEAMAAEKPLVTSDTRCLRNYFNKGTVYSKHDETSIVNAINVAYKERYSLINEIINWKATVDQHQNNRILNIYKKLEESCNPPEVPGD